LKSGLRSYPEAPTASAGLPAGGHTAQVRSFTPPLGSVARAADKAGPLIDAAVIATGFGLSGDLLDLIRCGGRILVSMNADAGGGRAPGDSQRGPGRARRAGDDVNTEGHDAGTVGGIAGPQTKAATSGALSVEGQLGTGTAAAAAAMAFQRAVGPAAESIVGVNTWPALVVAVRMGSTGPAVREVQAVFDAHGSMLTVDAEFRARGSGAVEAFESSQGPPVNGLFNAVAWQSPVA